MTQVKAMLGIRSVALRAGGEKDPMGTTATLSWPGLAESLRKAGVISAHEDVAAFVIDDDGIQIRIVSR